MFFPLSLPCRNYLFIRKSIFVFFGSDEDDVVLEIWPFHAVVVVVWLDAFAWRRRNWPKSLEEAVPERAFVIAWNWPFG